MGIKIKHKKLRPKAPKEPKYTKWLHDVKKPPCFVCGIHLGIQMHHVKKDSADERIDSKQIPLCFEHHHGLELSPHGTATAWRYTFPMWEQEEAASKLYKEYKNV